MQQRPAHPERSWQTGDLGRCAACLEGTGAAAPCPASGRWRMRTVSTEGRGVKFQSRGGVKRSTGTDPFSFCSPSTSFAQQLSGSRAPTVEDQGTDIEQLSSELFTPVSRMAISSSELFTPVSRAATKNRGQAAHLHLARSPLPEGHLQQRVAQLPKLPALQQRAPARLSPAAPLP